jgi:hypothetical protein
MRLHGIQRDHGSSVSMMSGGGGGHTHASDGPAAVKKTGSWGTSWLKKKTGDGEKLHSIVEGALGAERELERARRDNARAKERAKKEAQAAAAAIDPLALLQQEQSQLEQLSGLIEQFLVDGEVDEEDDKLFWSQSSSASGTFAGAAGMGATAGANWQVECHRLERALLLAPDDVQASVVPVLAQLSAEVGFGLGAEADEMGIIETLKAIQEGTYAPAVEQQFASELAPGDASGISSSATAAATTGEIISDEGGGADTAATAQVVEASASIGDGTGTVDSTAAEASAAVAAEANADDEEGSSAPGGAASVLSELLGKRGGFLGKRVPGAAPSEAGAEALTQLDQLAVSAELGESAVEDGAGGGAGSVLSELLAKRGGSAGAEPAVEPSPPAAAVAVAIAAAPTTMEEIRQQPKFKRWAMMTKQGLPEGAVRQKMAMEGMAAADIAAFFGDGGGAGSGGAGQSGGATGFVRPASVVQTGPQPTVKMRALYWEKLDESAVADAWWNAPEMKSTLGDELTTGKKIQGRMEELQHLFGGGIVQTGAAQKAALPVGETVARDSTVATPGRVTLLESRRANNIGITLAKLKMSGPEIVECLLTLDEKRLDLNTLELVQLLLPEEEEVKALQKYEREHPECVHAVAIARTQHRKQHAIAEEEARERQKRREAEEQREEQEERERELQAAVLPGKKKKKKKKKGKKGSDEGWVVSRITQAQSIQLDDEDLDRISFGGSFSLDDRENSVGEQVGALEEKITRARALSAKQKIDMAAFNKLRKTEQVLLVLLHVPQLGEKLECLELRLTAEERVRSLSHQCRALSDACAQLCESSTLKSYMALVCQVGNFLNWGSARGGAKGISLAALEKLASVKSRAPAGAAAKTAQNYTLLHYTAHLAQSADGDSPPLELRKMRAELSKLSTAVELDLHGLQVELRELRQGLKKLEKQAQQPVVGAAATPGGEGEDDEKGEEEKEKEQLRAFASAMRSTASAVETQLAAAAADHEKAISRMAAMLRYFGEDAKTVDAVSWMKRLLVLFLCSPPLPPSAALSNTV